MSLYKLTSRPTTPLQLVLVWYRLGAYPGVVTNLSILPVARYWRKEITRPNKAAMQELKLLSSKSAQFARAFAAGGHHVGMGKLSSRYGNLDLWLNKVLGLV